MCREGKSLIIQRSTNNSFQIRFCISYLNLIFCLICISICTVFFQEYFFTIRRVDSQRTYSPQSRRTSSVIITVQTGVFIFLVKLIQTIPDIPVFCLLMAEIQTQCPINPIFRPIDRGIFHCTAKPCIPLFPHIGCDRFGSDRRRDADDCQQRICLFLVIIEINIKPIIEKRQVGTDIFVYRFLPF